MNKQNVRLVVAGLGLAGQRHVKAIQKIQNVELIAVVEPDKSKINDGQGEGVRGGDAEGGSGQIDGQGGGAEGKDKQVEGGQVEGMRVRDVAWFNSLTKMLKNNKPDGVIIATPNQMHVEMAEECIKNDVPILVEKPVADSVEGAEKIAKMKGKILAGYHRRHHPIIAKAKKIIENGELGEITAVHASVWLYKPDSYFDAEWRKKDGAGPLFINLAHDIDLIQYLCGTAQTISAFESNNIRKHEVEDTVVVAMKLQNNALVTVTMSDTIVAPYSWEMTAKENPIYPETDEDCYRIGGTHGTLVLPNLRVWSQQKRSWWEPMQSKSITTRFDDPFVCQIRHFAEVIRGNQNPIVTPEDAIKNQQVLNAIKKSAQTNKVVEIK